MSRPRLGFLGTGWIGRHRLEAIVRSGVAEVAALSDPTPVALDAARLLAPQAKILSGLDEMLECGIDGLVIATPSAQHSVQSIAALNHGLAVFCQKPLGRSGTETADVVRVARTKDRLLGVDLSYRHTAAMQQLRPLIQDGALGTIHAATLVFHNAYGPDKPWFYDSRLSGGGCVMDLGIHLVDLALWSLGFPAVSSVSTRMFAEGRPFEPRPGAVEDFAAAQITLSSGAVLQLACSWKLHAGADAIIEASFYGSRGGVSMRNVNGSFYDFTADRFTSTTRQRLADPPDAWGGRAAVDWATRFAQGHRFDPAAEHLVEVATTIDRIRNTIS